MSEEELQKTFENIQMQMVAEQNIGYKNKYSNSLQERISLYNYVIALKQALNEIRELLTTSTPQNVIRIPDVLQIIDKVSGSDK